MTPMTFDEWCAADGNGIDQTTRDQRYRAYVAGVDFIRSQIGGMPPVAPHIAARTVVERTYVNA